MRKHATTALYYTLLLLFQFRMQRGYRVTICPVHLFFYQKTRTSSVVIETIKFDVTSPFYAGIPTHFFPNNELTYIHSLTHQRHAI